ncbi:MAG: GFA family protein [Reyranellaceae bacterium]
MSQMSGGCLCGKIRYTSSAEPVMSAICHCKNCQKQAGTAFSVIVAVPKPALSVSGTLKSYADKGDSGKPVYRNFCPDCGSPVTTIVDAIPDLVFIKAGTLDDTSTLKPTMEIFCSSAQPWTTQAGERQKFAKAPG